MAKGSLAHYSAAHEGLCEVEFGMPSVVTCDIAITARCRQWLGFGPCRAVASALQICVGAVGTTHGCS
jgi:hypothetical protein